MRRLIFLFLLLLVCVVCAQGQFTTQNARRIFSGTGAPGVGNPATPSCQPGPSFTDYYTNTTDHSVWQCTSAPNNWTKVVGGSTPGTVTTVSVASANGQSGTVANATTTPAITLGNPSALVATTSVAAPFFVSAAADPADAGAIRLGNNEVVGWEKATPGTDWTFGVNASDILATNAPFSAPNVTATTNLTIGAGSAITSSGAGGALGTGAFANTGTSGATIPLLNGANTVSGVETHSKAVIVSNVALTDNGATIATDASLSNNFRVGALTANVTLSNPTNSVDGQVITWEVIQNASAAKTLAFGTNFAFGAEITGCTISATLSSHNFITAIYNSTMTKWLIRGCLTGY